MLDDHQLCDPVSVADEVWNVAMINETDADFAAVIRIDYAHAVRESDAGLDSHAASGEEKRNIFVGGQFDGDTGMNKEVCTRLQHNGIIEERKQIHTCRTRRRTSWDNSPFIGFFDLQYFHKDLNIVDPGEIRQIVVILGERGFLFLITISFFFLFIHKLSKGLEPFFNAESVVFIFVRK